MQLEIPLSLGALERAIPSIVAVMCTGIIGWELVVSKLRPRCVICSFGVAHGEHADDIPVPCHKKCRYVALLM